MKNIGKEYCILLVVLLACAVFTGAGFCAHDPWIEEENSVMPTEAPTFQSVQEAVTVPEIPDTDTSDTIETTTPSIEESANPPAVPTIPSSYVTFSKGQMDIPLVTGAFCAEDLQSLWAKVTYTDGWHTGPTEYWQLDLSQLSDDGKSVHMEFGKNFHGVPIEVQFYGIDNTGKQTETTNASRIAIVNSPSNPDLMPKISDAGITVNDDNTITIKFDSGTLKPDQVSRLWGKVFYFDKQTGKQSRDWITSSTLSADGTSVTLPLTTKYNAWMFQGTKVQIELNAFDTSGNSLGFTDPVTVDCGSYCWGPIPDANVISYEQSLDNFEHFSDRRQMTSTIEDNKLSVQIDYQYKARTIGNDWEWKTSYSETATLDLKTGEVTKADGTKVATTEGDTYVKAVNSLLSTIRLQSRYGADAAGQTTLNQLGDYLINIKEQSGASKYYYGSGLEAMSIGSDNVNVKVSGDTLSVGDVNKYLGYAMDMVTGDIIVATAGSGHFNAMPGSTYYAGAVQAMKDIVNQVSDITTDPSQKAQLQGVTDYLNKISAPSVSLPALPATATTNRNGSVTLDFTSGTLFANQLNEFWAQVSCDGKTESWNLGTNALGAEGDSITMRFNRNFSGKTVMVQFYGVDINGKQTNLSNSVDISVSERRRRLHNLYNQ